MITMLKNHTIKYPNKYSTTTQFKNLLVNIFSFILTTALINENKNENQLKNNKKIERKINKIEKCFFIVTIDFIFRDDKVHSTFFFYFLFALFSSFNFLTFY